MNTGSPGNAHNPRVHVRWAGDGRFDVGRPDGPAVRLDSSGAAGPSPVDALLSALGACASVDVVEILGKRRTPVASLEVEIVAERVDAVPRRLKSATLHFTLSGAGIDRVQAERAIELSVTKYCSVRDSLREDVAVDWTLTLDSPAESGQSVASAPDDVRT